MARKPFPIFLYHGIDGGRGAPPQRFDVSLDAFSRQMDLLEASERRTRTISDLADRLERDGERAAAVTFDDGTADFYKLAWPVIRDRGLAVTLYVIAGLVGKHYLGRAMLDWRQLEELRDAGVEIGAHGHRHVALDVLPLDRAAIELVNGKLLLERRLDVHVTSFAYPFGYHTRALEQLLPAVGYTSACAVKNSLSHAGDDCYALARLTLNANTTTTRFEQLLDGRGAPASWHGEHLRTRAWRAYRRARAMA